MADDDSSVRPLLIRRALEELRALSAALTLLTQATAERMGITPTDLQCLNVIHQLGLPTASEVAARTRLSSSSITGVIDRLERAGYVQRTADPADRRRVRLRPTARAGEQAATLFLPQLRELGGAYAQYSSADLQTIGDFLERTHRLVLEQTSNLGSPAEH